MDLPADFAEAVQVPTIIVVAGQEAHQGDVADIGERHQEVIEALGPPGDRGIGQSLGDEQSAQARPGPPMESMVCTFALADG
jgi:hypothetical protein